MSDRDNSILSPELVRRAQAGDEAAFNELYQRTGAMIYRTILSMVRDEDTAWDIHQNSYILAYRSLKKLENPEAFLNWLRRIAVNEAIKATTKEQPLRFSELADEDGELPQFEETRDSYQPELEMDRQEAARLVREILKKLPERQQLIVGMYYYESYSIREIAEALNITQGTVKTQLHLGRKRVEAEVRRLEAEGIKLYGMSPMAFLVFLLRNQEPARQIGKKAAQAVVTKALSGQPVVLTAKTAGTGFFHTALGKLTAVALSAAVVAGGVLGYQALQDKLEARMGDYRPTQTLVSTEHAPALTEAEIAHSTDERNATEPIAQTEPQATPPAAHKDPVSGSCGENLSWTFYPDSGLLAIEGNGAMEDYVSSGDGYISDHDKPWASFQGEIVTISFPEGLTRIGKDAFRWCRGLKTVLSLPEGLQSIGPCAFEGCKGLSEISFPQSLRTIDAYAFSVTGLTSVTFSEGLTEIGEDAFQACSLTELTLPEGLTDIGEGAFRLSGALTRVTIPASVEQIGNYAFQSCYALQEINVDENNPVYGSVDGVLYSHYNEKLRNSVLLLYPAGKTGAFAMGNTVYEVEDYAFEDCKGLTEIRFSENLFGIGGSAFSGCSGLTV